MYDVNLLSLSRFCRYFDACRSEKTWTTSTNQILLSSQYGKWLKWRSSHLNLCMALTTVSYCFKHTRYQKVNFSPWFFCWRWFYPIFCTSYTFSLAYRPAGLLGCNWLATIVLLSIFILKQLLFVWTNAEEFVSWSVISAVFTGVWYVKTFFFYELLHFSLYSRKPFLGECSLSMVYFFLRSSLLHVVWWCWCEDGALCGTYRLVSEIQSSGVVINFFFSVCWFFLQVNMSEQSKSCELNTQTLVTFIEKWIVLWHGTWFFWLQVEICKIDSPFDW